MGIFDKPEKYEEMIKEKWKSLTFWDKFWDGQRFSPSRLMISLSDYVTLSWILIFIGNVIVIFSGSPTKISMEIFGGGFAIVTLVYIRAVIRITGKHHDDFMDEYA